MTPTEPIVARKASLKVLLVDDDDAIRDVMSLTLEHKGFQVVTAASVHRSFEAHRYRELRRTDNRPQYAERR